MQCNSNHSRLMGFFTAVPGIIRLVQCLRRYYSSKLLFPHIANGGKYASTIVYYMTLSIWRLDTHNLVAKALFITFASINSIYSTVWDINCDWSLLDPYARKPFLRKSLGFKPAWPYYLAIAADPVIRCNWLLYVVYAGQLQHSALLSFMLALSEVLRRFMWCFFRMENEHIGNVGAGKAYRVVPLPYRLPGAPAAPAESADGSDASADLEGLRQRHPRAQPPQTPVLHTIHKVGRSLKAAHLQDYEKRRTRAEVEEDEDAESLSGDSDDEDEEDYYERTREDERRGTRASRM